MDSYSEHQFFMRRCLELARKGKGRTGANPMVGSVIVHKGKIIGEGYHREYGGPHAEVNAINSVVDKDLLKESTLYVNLEPCSHYGKTPPCSLLIKNMKIPRVVIGSTDPNPQVAGRGIMILESSGCKVIKDVLKQECLHFNREFFTHISQNRPYVVLKWAQSRDGFIDVIRKPGAPVQPTWITNHTARKLVHKWRGELTGIFAGVDTILADNPGLNLREWSGNQPVRITIDRNNRISDEYRIKDGSQKTIIYTQKPDKKKKALYQKTDLSFSVQNMLTDLYEKGISSLLVEGGAKMLKSFIDSGLWDEARVFKGNMDFGSGIRAPELTVKQKEVIPYRNNKLMIYFHQIREVGYIS